MLDCACCTKTGAEKPFFVVRLYIKRLLRRTKKQQEMSGKPKNELMTPAQMLEMAKERRMNSKIYSRVADDGTVVHDIVAQLAEELSDIPPRADLKNTENIRRLCKAYILICGEAGTLPTKQGLARCLGMSRRNLDFFCTAHPDHPTAQLLEVVFDGFVEALNQAALAKAVDNVTGIFLSKAIFGYVDKVTVEPVNVQLDPLGERKSAVDMAAIAARYDDIPGGLPD